jgi:SET domain-containing protein 6
MKAIKPIKAGEELFNDYGPLPRSDLLRRYGYTSDRYSQYDVVEFSMKSITHACDATGDVNLDAKLEYLDDMDLFEDGYSVGHPPAGATLTDAIPEELQFVIMALLSPEAPKANRKLLKPRLGLSDAKFLQKLVKKRLAQYSTTTAEDTAILENLAQQHQLAENNAQTRLKMAVEVRLGEKQILHRLSEVILSFIADNDESKKRPGSNQGTKTKKQKLK